MLVYYIVVYPRPVAQRHNLVNGCSKIIPVRVSPTPSGGFWTLHDSLPEKLPLDATETSLSVHSHELCGRNVWTVYYTQVNNFADHISRSDPSRLS